MFLDISPLHKASFTDFKERVQRAQTSGSRKLDVCERRSHHTSLLHVRSFTLNDSFPTFAALQ